MKNLLGIKNFNEDLKISDQIRIHEYIINNTDYSKKESSIPVYGKASLLSLPLPIKKKDLQISQPITDESGRYVLILNGSIYNYQELKNELLKLGRITFQTSSDSETLLHFLIENKERGIHRLEGDFAFAFYDTLEDELLLVRDQLGVKPLLFSIQKEEILFASELTPFKYWLTDWEIDSKALNAFFRFTYVPAPDTMIKGVHKLLPGHFLKVKGKEIDVQSYATLRKVEKINLSYEEAVKLTKEKLEAAVIKRIKPNTEIGSFLSGGVDSSIVAQVMTTFQSDLKTFSIGYKDQTFFDESKFAQEVADHINSTHQQIRLGPEEVVPAFQKLLSSFDEPYADSSVIAGYFLMQEAKKSADICLSGDGADEILAGYYKHKAFQRSKSPGFLLQSAGRVAELLPGGNRRGKIPNRIRQLKKFKALLKEEWPNSYWFLAQFISRKQRRNLLQGFADVEYKLIDSEKSLQSFLFYDQEFVLPNDMLKKVDVMSRFHGFEVRAPFLDKEFMEFANGLPEEYKLKGNIGKRILRDAFRDVLPATVFSRPKKGFEVPLHDWIKSTWANVVSEEWFDKEYLSNQALFSYEGALQLKADFEAGKEEEATVTMWAYIVFQNWYQRWQKK